MNRTAIGLLVASFILLLTGCSGGAAGPQAAFDKFKSSLQKKDFDTAMSQLTPESQDYLLSLMAGIAELVYLDPAKANTREELAVIVEKHGVKDVSKAIVDDSLFAVVTDKPGCASDLQAFLEKHGQAATSPANQFASAQLDDVKISGDTAEGKISGRPFKFKQINGVWLVDLVAGVKAALDSIPATLPSGTLPNSK